MKESALREQMAMHGRSLYERGLSGGSSGNISVRLEDGLLVTPSNCCLGRLDPGQIAKVGWDGAHLGGEKPSKEAFLHLAMYEERPETEAVVHLHSTHSVAVACLDGADVEDVLPPITAYYVMRVGKLPLIPYFKPGDIELAAAVRAQASKHHAVLLANHGPVVAGQGLDAAVYAIEELEETAKLYLLLKGLDVRRLSKEQVAELRAAFPN